MQRKLKQNVAKVKVEFNYRLQHCTVRTVFVCVCARMCVNYTTISRHTKFNQTPMYVRVSVR